MTVFFMERLCNKIIAKVTNNTNVANMGYSAGEFQALQLIVLATLGVVD